METTDCNCNVIDENFFDFRSDFLCELGGLCCGDEMGEELGCWDFFDWIVGAGAVAVAVEMGFGSVCCGHVFLQHSTM